jgi:hypothetical protein
LVLDLAGEGVAIDRLAYRKKPGGALAGDDQGAGQMISPGLARASVTGCGHRPSAGEGRVVAYLEDCEARGLSVATVSRYCLASLAVIHGLLGVTPPGTGAPVVRDALRGFRRRRGVRQRQAGPPRLGEGIGIEAARGFTLTALLDACPGTAG